MGKFIIVSFLALGLAFYEFSGGADFVPEQRIVVAEAEVTNPTPFVQTTNVQVTRSNSASLTALNPAVTTVSLEAAPIAEPAVVEVAAPIIVEDPVQEVFEIVNVALDIRAVGGSRVNMRQGPGTTFDVLDTLNAGTEAEVLEVNADGWARVQILNTGQVGWMAERLLTDG